MRSKDCSLSWACRSLALLRRYDLPDWPEWRKTGGDLDGYCTHVRCTLERHHSVTWKAAVSRHSLSVPYHSIVPSIHEWTSKSFSIQLSWDTLMQRRSAARLRCGLIDLGHLHGKRTRARAQQCVFCDELVSQLWLHVFCACPVWSEKRNHVMRCMPSLECSRGWTIMQSVLSAPCDSSQYHPCIDFIDAVVRESDLFWKNAKHICARRCVCVCVCVSVPSGVQGELPVCSMSASSLMLPPLETSARWRHLQDHSCKAASCELSESQLLPCKV